MIRAFSSRNYVLKCIIVILCVLLIAGCTSVKLISDYDETTDKYLTEIQQNTDDFIETLIQQSGTDEAAFSRHQDFYEEIDRKIRRLEFRVDSIPNNKKTIDLVTDIRLVILGEGKCTEDGTSLRDIHCTPSNSDKGPSVAALEICRRNINQTISAALALELAKKRGS